MFSTDADFNLGAVLTLESVIRVSGGIYEITVTQYDGEEGLYTPTYIIDARKAILDLKKISCDDFDCQASEEFGSSITMVRKYFS